MDLLIELGSREPNNRRLNTDNRLGFRVRKEDVYFPNIDIEPSLRETARDENLGFQSEH